MAKILIRSGKPLAFNSKLLSTNTEQSDIVLDIVNNTLLKVSSRNAIEDTSFTISSANSTIATVERNAGVQDLSGCEWTNANKSVKGSFTFWSKLLYKLNSTDNWAQAVRIDSDRRKTITGSFPTYYTNYTTTVNICISGAGSVLETIAIASATNTYDGYDTPGEYPVPRKTRNVWLKFYAKDDQEYVETNELYTISTITSMYNIGEMTLPANVLCYYDLSTNEAFTALNNYSISVVGNAEHISDTIIYHCPAALEKTINNGEFKTNYSSYYKKTYAEFVPTTDSKVLAKFEANRYYELPNSINVSGCEYSYNSTTGNIELWHATDTVSISVDCQLTQIAIAKEALNCVIAGPDTSGHNEEVQFTIIPDTGYCIPNFIGTTSGQGSASSYLTDSSETIVYDGTNLSQGIISYTRKSTTASILHASCSKIMPITVNSSHCSYVANFNGISENEFGAHTVLTFTPNSGYALPVTQYISVTPSTDVSFYWYRDTGRLIFYPTHNKTITTDVIVNVEAVVPNPVTLNCTNGTISGPTTLPIGLTETYTITPNPDFSLPSEVTIAGTTSYDYDSVTGVITLTCQGNAITITAECIGVAAIIDVATRLDGATLTTPNYGTTYEETGSSISHTYTFSKKVTSFTVVISDKYCAVVTLANDGMSAILTIRDNDDNSYSWRDIEDNNCIITFYSIDGQSDFDTFVAQWSQFWCFIANTKILLANGTTKNAEDITYDDELLVWNFYEGKFDSAKPQWIMEEKIAPEYNLLSFDDGSSLGLVGPAKDIGYHRIFNKEAGKFTHTGVADTPIGTTTFNAAGNFTKLIDQKVIKKEVKYYNIITDKHYNLFTNGILTSCRLSNQYKIEDMKYVGEKQFDDAFITDYLNRLK